MDSIDILLREFGPSVYSFIVSMIGRCDDADDIYQTVFLRLFEKKPSFRDRRAARAWLLKVARNCTADVINARKRTVELKDDVAVLDDPDIFEIIGALPENYREAVYLHYQHGMSLKEIAQITGLTVNGVKSRLRRARLILKEVLQ